MTACQSPPSHAVSTLTAAASASGWPWGACTRGQTRASWGTTPAGQAIQGMIAFWVKVSHVITSKLTRYGAPCLRQLQRAPREEAGAGPHERVAVLSAWAKRGCAGSYKRGAESRTSAHCTLAMWPPRVRSSQLASYSLGPVADQGRGLASTPCVC